jgi:hypothetical protein
MKQSIILWTAAAVITFLAGFLQSRLSNEYPISGSFGIEGKEIGYKLDKVYYGNDDYKFFLKSEIDRLAGSVYWKASGTEEWSKSELIDSGEILSGKIPNYKPLTNIDYYIRVDYNNKSYNIPPDNKPVTITFYSKIPASVNFYYWFTLFGVLLLAVRTGLEYFHIPDKIKKLNVFTLIFVFVNVFAFHPLRTTYKLGAVGKSVIPVTQMFQFPSILLLLTWILATALIFNSRNFRIWAPAAAAITLFIYELGHF